MNRALALILALGVVAAGMLAAGSSGAHRTRRTIGMIVPGPGSPTAPREEHGAESAAAALGDRLTITVAGDAQAQIGAIKSLITQHAAAIAITTDEGQATIDQVLPALARARAAGIPTLSFEQRYPGSVWVNQSGPAQYAHALADALAAQMKQRGQYVIVPCRPAESVVQTWLRAVTTYIPRRHPRMRRVGVIYGGTGNGDEGTLVLLPVLRAHPHLGGFVFLCPSESFTGPPQLIKDHVLGKVFSAGNGADCPPVYSAFAWNIRRGAEEVVCGGDPTKLGYLTAWAADYLATGHKLAPGKVHVGGPIGTVEYFEQNEELRLGQPLTITRANLARYVAG